MNARVSARQRRKLIYTALGWSIGAVLFFPIFWMGLTSLKTEAQAVASPPLLLFKPTLDSFARVLSQTDYLHFAGNSVVVALGSTLIAVLFALPAAYAMVFHPSRYTKDLLLWMLSTKMMPAVGVLVPIYLLFRATGLLDTRAGLLGIYTLMNLPIVMWMLYSFFRDVPAEIFEAARIDGAGIWQEMFVLLVPLAAPGIASTILLNTVLSWNEAFWSINLTAADAAPLTAFIATFSSPEGLFWAKLSAASVLAVVPIMCVGWTTQRQLVSGLTFGAVK